MTPVSYTHLDVYKRQPFAGKRRFASHPPPKSGNDHDKCLQKFTGFGPLLCKSGSMLRIEYKGKIRTRVVPSTIVVSIFSKDNPFFRTHINVKNPKRDPCLYSFGVISHDLLGYNLLSPCFAQVKANRHYESISKGNRESGLFRMLLLSFYKKIFFFRTQIKTKSPVPNQ